MNKKELEILQNLRNIIVYNQNLLSVKGCELYLKLANKADNLNIVW